MASHGWSEYLREFHQRQAGITERVLLPARDVGGGNPYDWLAQALPTTGTVVDLACGSAPLSTMLPAAVAYIGVDRSPAELALAARRVPSDRLRQGDAVDLPDLVGSGMAAVACSMALQVLEPLPDVLQAVAATLTPGGTLVATVPSTAAFTLADRVRWAACLAALGRRTVYPNDALLGRLPTLAESVDLVLEADGHRRFTLRVDHAEDAQALIDSLYLPGLGPRRRSAGVTAVRAAAAAGGLAVSLRRVILRRR